MAMMYKFQVGVRFGGLWSDVEIIWEILDWYKKYFGAISIFWAMEAEPMNFSFGSILGCDRRDRLFIGVARRC